MSVKYNKLFNLIKYLLSLHAVRVYPLLIFIRHISVTVGHFVVDETGEVVMPERLIMSLPLARMDWLLGVPRIIPVGQLNWTIGMCLIDCVAQMLVGQCCCNMTGYDLPNSSEIRTSFTLVCEDLSQPSHLKCPHLLNSRAHMR